MSGKGNQKHVGHPHVREEASLFTARLLDQAERGIAESVIRADASSNGVLQNVVNKRNGLALAGIIATIIFYRRYRLSKELSSSDVCSIKIPIF